MADTLLAEPQIRLSADTPDLMGLFSDLKKQVAQAKVDRLVLSISTDLAEMLSVFDEEDQAEFWREFRQAIHVPGDALETMLEEWFTTSQALSDPVRREILLGDSSDDDYVEVSRPQ